VFKKILFLAFVITLVSGILITGCAKTTETPTTSTPPTTPTPTVTTAQQYGGTLRIISGADVTCLGWAPEQLSGEDYYHRTPAIETLVRFDPKTNGPVPFLAEQVIEDSSAKTITFVLRKNIQFQDGTDFDATACKWNLDQVMAGVNTSMDFANVSSIDVVNDYTVCVNFKAWDTVFLRLMCWDSAMVSPTAYEKNGVDWMRNNPVGTGPFKLVSFQRDVKKVFESWDGYWQKGKPYLDRIEITVVADPTVQVASFLSGEADIIAVVNATDAKNLKGNSSVKLLQGSVAGGLDCIFGDSANPTSPFANLKVRQAVSYAINYQAINDSIYKGFGKLTNQIAPPGSLTYNPNIVGYPYDPDKARELLKETEYADGFTTTIWCSSTPFYQDLYTAVQGYLTAVGIKADLKLQGPGQMGEMGFGTGWTNGLFGVGMVDDPEVGIDMRVFLAESSGTGIAKSIIHPDDVENATNQMFSAPDFETKQSKAWELQSLMFDKYCIFTPIMFMSNITAWSTKVHDELWETYTPQDPWSFADTWLEK
jgi:peptide/nickel transport system substrate-binding protein